MADRMELDEGNEDSLPGIGDLKTFSQVIRDLVPLASLIQLSMVCISSGLIKSGSCKIMLRVCHLYSANQAMYVPK